LKMYLIPIEEQLDAERLTHQQYRDLKKQQQTLPKPGRRDIKIEENYFTSSSHSANERQGFTFENKPLFQPHGSNSLSTEKSRLTPIVEQNDFPQHRGDEGWYNVQDRQIFSPADDNCRTKTQYENGRLPGFQTRNSYKHNRYYEQIYENTESPRQFEYEMCDYSSSEKFVEISSSSSRRLVYGTIGSQKRHNCYLFNNSSTSPYGYRSRCPRPFVEISESVHRVPIKQRRPRRKPSTNDIAEQWVRNESQAQRQLFHAATLITRKQTVTTGSRDQGKHNKSAMEDYQRARLLLESQKLDWDTDSESSEVEFEKHRVRRQKAPRKNLSIIIPSGRADNNKCTRPSATTNMATTPSTRCIQLDNLVRLETEKHQHVQVLVTDSEGNETDRPPTSIKISKAKLQEFVTRRYNNRRREIPQTPMWKDLSVHHPCYIMDNIRTVMGFLSVLELIRLKRVSKVWKIAVRSVLNKRTSYNITINPPSTAKMGGTLIRKLTFILPRLQTLSLSLKDFKDMAGPMPLFILSHICECQDLVFLRIESFIWREFDIAVKVILSSLENGHPIMSSLQILELPNASLPIPTSTQCMKPLSQLTPSLRSLMLNSAQDPVIFSLRLFMPSVKNLFLLNTLYTTQRFAQIITSSPMLMKHLMNDHVDYCPRTPMLTRSRIRNSAVHIKTPEGLTPTISTPLRVLTPGSRPVTPNDERLTPLTSRHNEPLYVEPLGSVYQIETGKELSKGMLQKFASFCAVIGSCIIMPPLDDEESRDGRRRKSVKAGR
jgi:hypothetical protein